MATRTGIMLPIPFSERLFDVMPKPVIVQPKLEGDRLRGLPMNEDGVIHMLSSSAKERNSIPHIREEMRKLNLGFEVDGEAYKHGMSHSTIRSIVSRTKNIHPKYKDIEYHIYDAVTMEDQVTRLDRIQNILHPVLSYIKIVKSYFCYSIEELQVYYEMFLEQGYEGIIIRHTDRPYKRSQVNWMLKLKPRLSGEYKIIGIEPMKDKIGAIYDDMMGKFILIDEEERVFKVGTGPKHTDRYLFMKNNDKLIGKKCKIRFQGFTKARGVPKMQSIDKDWLKQIRRVLR